MAPASTNVARCAALVLIAWAPLSAAAQAEGDVSEVMEAPFLLYVNHVDRDDILVALQGSEIYVDREDLLRAGIKPLGGEDVTVGGRQLLILSSVSPPLTYELDEEEIALRIEVPPEWLGHTRIDLTGRPPEVAYRTTTSAFFNYAPRLDDRGNASLYEETGLSIGGHLLFSGMRFSTDDAPRRGLTYLQLNDREELRRYTFGDKTVDTGQLGGGAILAGLTLERSYDLDPYVVTQPGIGMRGITAAPATLEVLVNGGRVLEQDIEPGTFELSNLLVAGGAGTAGYVIRDVFGNEQVFQAPFYAAPEALAVGREEYAYSMGVVRNALGQDSFDYGKPVGLARHRRGIDDDITLGARAEVSGELVSAGPTATLVLPVGQLDLALAGSHVAEGGLGGAAELGYTFSSRTFGARFFAGALSDRYVNTALDRDEDRARVQSGAAISFPVGPANVSGNVQVTSRRDTGIGTDMGCNVTAQIGAGLQWTTYVDRSTLGSASEWEVQTSLAWTPFARHLVRGTAAHGSRGSSGALSFSRSAHGIEDLGYRASIEYGPDLSADARAQYEASFARYAASYSYVNEVNVLSLETAGALVVVPGVGVLPTLPVQSAYGVVRTAGVRGVQVYGNNQEIAKTNRAGTVVVPNLLPYYGNLLRIEPNDLPLEYTVDATEMTLAPPPRGVALADFPVRVSRYYRGRIAIDTGGERSVPKWGQVTVRQSGEDAISPLGEEGEFDLDGVQPGSHSVLVEWPDGPCAFDVQFPDVDGSFIELGELTCKRDRPAPD